MVSRVLQNRIVQAVLLVLLLLGVFTFVSVPYGLYLEVQDYRQNVRPFVQALRQRVDQLQREQQKAAPKPPAEAPAK